MLPLPPITQNKFKRLQSLAFRLEAVFEAQEDMPRHGPAPAKLRGEMLRIGDALSRYFPPDSNFDRTELLRTKREPEMFDLFCATLEGIQAVNVLYRHMKSAQMDTYPRSPRHE